MILLSAFLSVPASVPGQPANNISVHIDNLTMRDALRQVESRSGMLFFMSDDLPVMDRRVTLSAENQSFPKLMDRLLRGHDLSYKIIDGKQVIIEPAKTAARESPAGSASITITGTVVDESGNPLPGVAIIVVGTGRGISTDAAGKYRLTVPGSESVLRFSFIGYAEVEMAVGSRTVIDVRMEEDVSRLDEVVVVGYGTQRRANITGAVATVKTEDLTRTPLPNPTNALAGRLPGLIVKQETGVPGGDGAALNIRGFGAPLVMIDGVEGNMGNIDAAQIESVTILKDASAAIYGARAGNGVILVTTKRGIVDKPVITFNAAYTLQGFTNRAKQASSGQNAELVREQHLQSGQPEETARFTQEQVDLFYAGTDPDYPNTDWWGVIADKFAPQQQYNVAVQGGSERIKYYGYLGYLTQESMFKNNGGKYDRYNIRGNIDAQILPNLSMQFDLSTIYEERRFPWRIDESVWEDYWNTEPYYPSTLPDQTKIPYANGGGTGGIHVISNSDLCGYRNTDSQNFNATLALNYDLGFLPGLSAKVFGNYRQNYSFHKEFEYLVETWEYNYATDTYTSRTGNTEPTLRHTDSRGRMLTGQFSLSYRKMFGDHDVSGLFMYEAIDYNDDWIAAQRINYSTTSIDYLFAGGNDSQYADGRASEMGRASWIGRVNYGYKNKYLLEATFRYDASAKFDKSERWGFFPSVSVGWRLSEEAFLKNAGAVSNLKLRLSYSDMGYDDVGSFQYLSGYNYGRLYNFSSASLTGIVSTGLANKYLTWEQMTIYNVGVDFSLFGSKLYGELDLFYRERKGIPATRATSLPTTFGAALPAENLNSLNDRGFEFTVGYVGKANDFRYNVRGNISWSRSKWDHFEEPEYTDPDQKRLYQRSGRWTDQVFGYKSNGLFTSKEQIDALDHAYTGGPNLQPGDIRYVNVNGDDVLDWRDQVEIGMGTVPHWMAGLSVDLNYKGFDLSALFQGAFGFYHNLVLRQGNTFSTVFYKERWTEETNDPNALIPRLGGAGSNGWISDYNYANASYLRLKTLSLGYTLPSKWLSAIKSRSVRVYVSGSNLFTISKLNKYKIDPEAPNGGGATGSASSIKYYPQLRTYTFGLSLSF